MVWIKLHFLWNLIFCKSKLFNCLLHIYFYLWIFNIFNKLRILTKKMRTLTSVIQMYYNLFESCINIHLIFRTLQNHIWNQTKCWFSLAFDQLRVFKCKIKLGMTITDDTPNMSHCTYKQFHRKGFVVFRPLYIVCITTAVWMCKR